ncbi:unnamed protein product [Gongylonema pulchrum]|uniref:Uncharacterized protein n=1 Tax=Gongylonema pulchrum TaxID=637853 RepID=A0A183DBR3_9BILA|nr:unnamed protein product [Gongylonema pulchrum]
MRDICDPNELIGALDVLQDYYKHDLLDQMRSLTESATEHLYPFMCRQYLPVEYHLKVSSFLTKFIECLSICLCDTLVLIILDQIFLGIVTDNIKIEEIFA